MDSLNNYQTQYLQGIFKTAMQGSVAALSKMLAREVCHGKEKISITKVDQPLTHGLKAKTELTVLTTPLMGDLPGRSYLVLNSLEVDSVLTHSKFNNDPSNTLMRDALLLELDNILCASFITVLSEKLSVQIFGNVPQLQRTDLKNFNDSVNNYNPDPGVAIAYQSHFTLLNYPDFSPAFIWKVSQNILNSHLQFSRPNSTENIL